MKINDDQVREIIESLEGTCDTLDGAVEEVTGDGDLSAYDLTEEQSSTIDQEIFNCDECGWWYEISEMSEKEEHYCIDCMNCRT